MIRRILISLDALLDTRLGVVSLLNQDAASHLVRTPDYWYRVYDDWYKLTGGLITNEQFREAWASRGGVNTQQTLTASFETGLAPFVYQLLVAADVNMLSGMTKEEDEIGLAINIAPYTFSLQEKQTLIEIMQAKYGRELSVTIVDHPIADLTVEVLSDYGAMILYDFAEWFKIHHVAIVSVLMSDIAVIHPKLFDRDPSELTVEEMKHDFLRFRLATQHNLDINYIDTSYFSLVDITGKLEQEVEVSPVPVDLPIDETACTYFMP